ncbi:MAG: Peptidyl-tRNA hydrolase [uncultured bacterium]|nr:MAG: Peptidyl-tRNA hydrolase [uncultured bacterium]HBD05621.1 aminoacyl-tRNA hydrolase [Candidatus Uhrbacteria bacterium]
MKIIVGLGNPGKEYEHTRHNIGFMVADSVAKNISAPFKNKPDFRAHIAIGEHDGERAVLVKPDTFMNLSGEAVLRVLDFYKNETIDLIVIHDDADLGIGDIRIKKSGSSAGHNGIKSIMDAIGTDKFTRVRVGIGRPENKSIPLDKWVLAKITKTEFDQQFAPMIESASKKAVE